MLLKEEKAENLKFGLSTLHGWIRFFECLLHLSYKLPIRRWQARSVEDKEIVAKTKNRIQNEFKEKLGFLIDLPKPGFGSSNDGNTARRFFQNAELSAEITKIDISLLERMHTILIVVSCNHDINVDKFKNYALETARHFVNLYPWCNMSPTLHKFFIHGPEIIKYALLPIGQLTEEAQEARNKDFKFYREHFSRKCSREKCNLDVLNRMLITSDPLVSRHYNSQEKKINQMPKSALDLLQNVPEVKEEYSNLSDFLESSDEE